MQSPPETRTITVHVYRDPDGHATCCAAWMVDMCQFLTVRKFGTIQVCGYTGKDLHRRPHDADRRDMVRDPKNHYLRPEEGCPLWT